VGMQEEKCRGAGRRDLKILIAAIYFRSLCSLTRLIIVLTPSLLRKFEPIHLVQRFHTISHDVHFNFEKSGHIHVAQHLSICYSLSLFIHPPLFTF